MILAIIYSGPLCRLRQEKLEAMLPVGPTDTFRAGALRRTVPSDLPGSTLNRSWSQNAKRPIPMRPHPSALQTRKIKLGLEASFAGGPSFLSQTGIEYNLSEAWALTPSRMHNAG